MRLKLQSCRTLVPEPPCNVLAQRAGRPKQQNSKQLDRDQDGKPDADRQERNDWIVGRITHWIVNAV
jgi:hypothetical protein